MSTATSHVHGSASLAPPSPPADASCASVDDLRQLMRSVEETTRALEGTHAALRHEVGRLQRELAEANAQLRRSQALAALGEMAAGIAHEIRNPLGSIRLYVQMLAEDLASAPAQVELCEKIVTAVTGLDAIVRDVLLFARDMRPRRCELPVADLVAPSIEQCAGLMASAGVQCRSSFECEMPGREMHVKVDAVLIQQAIANLLRNAIEAMAETPQAERRLAITAERRRVRRPDGRSARAIVIRVDDAGPGIPSEVEQRMFNPFFTTRPTGTGLGLAIVHRIVAAHEGHLAVSRSRWGGASVEICLPCHEQDEAPPAPQIVTRPTEHARKASNAGGVSS